MTSRTFATLFALTALAVLVLPTSAQANCTARDGTSAPTGGKQACPPSSMGSGMICKADGTWDNSACTVTPAGAPPPGWCGSAQEGVVHACPAGTSCKARRITAPRPWYCPFWIIISHLLRVAEPTSWRQQIGSAIPSREAGQKLANSAAWPYILRVNVSVAYAYQEDRARHGSRALAAQETACREPE